MILELDGASASQPGQHVEMWGRNDHDDIIRISYLDPNTGGELKGFQIRVAVDPRDPCIINDAGYLLTDPAAYPPSVTLGGVIQTAEEQAQQIVTKIRQVTSLDLGGIQATNLLLATPYDETPWPSLAPTTAAADRLAACQQAYWAAPLSYTPDPSQLGTPLHGISLGPVTYQTSSPMQTFKDIYFDSPFDLSNLVELWFTIESTPPDGVDPLHRGPTWLEGMRSDPGRGGVVNFTLRGNDGSIGSIALIVGQEASAF
jgi:hypothetical protein